MTRPAIHKEKLKELLKIPNDDIDIIRSHVQQEDELYQNKEIITIIEKLNRVQMRKPYANKLFWFSVASFSIIISIVVATGAGWLVLSDTIIQTLIISMFVEILALLAIAVRFIFSND